MFTCTVLTWYIYWLIHFKSIRSEAACSEGHSHRERGATRYQCVTSRSNLVKRIYTILQVEVDVGMYAQEKRSSRNTLCIMKNPHIRNVNIYDSFTHDAKIFTTQLMVI